MIKTWEAVKFANLDTGVICVPINVLHTVEITPFVPRRGVHVMVVLMVGLELTAHSSVL